MWFIIGFFVVCVGGCYLIFKSIGEAIFGKSENKPIYIDQSVNHHYHDNRTIHVDGETFKGMKKEIK